MAAANPWNQFVKRYYREVQVQEHPVAERAQVLARMYRAKKEKLRPRLMSGRPNTPRGASFNFEELLKCKEDMEGLNEQYNDCMERLANETRNAEAAHKKLVTLHQIHNDVIKSNFENEFKITEEISRLKGELKLLGEQASVAEANCTKRLAELSQKNEEAWARVAELQLITNASTKQVTTAEAYVAELQRDGNRRLAVAEQAISACNARADAAEARAVELQKEGTRLLAVAEAQAAELQQAIGVCNARAEAAEARVMELQKEGTKHSVTADARVAELQQAISVCRARAEAAEAAEARVAELQKEGAIRLSVVEARVAELQQAISVCDARAEAGEARVAELTRQLQELRVQHHKELSRVELLDKQLKKCESNLHHRETNVKKLAQNLKEFKLKSKTEKADNEKIASKLRLTETRVAELTRDQSRHMDSIAMLKQQRTDLKKKLKSCEKTTAALRRTIKNDHHEDNPMPEMNGKRKKSSPTLPVQPPRYNLRPRLQLKRAKLPSPDMMSGSG